MATSKKSLIPLLVEAEIYPDDPSYPFDKPITKEQEKIDYWYKMFVADFKAFPACDGSSKQNWSGSSSINGTSWKKEWESMARRRIRWFSNSDPNKHGFKVFRNITGYYQLHISDDKTIDRQQTRLRQLLGMMKDSEYGLIDPLTGKEAVLDLETSDGRITYFFPDMSNPSTVSYGVLEAEVAPLLMTDTLIESNVRGMIYGLYRETGDIPNPKAVFPKVMQAGRESQVFESARENIPRLRVMIQSIVDEMASMSLEELATEIDGYEVELPEYGEAGELLPVVKTISLKQFLALKFENAKVKSSMQRIRPPVEGMKRGKDWPSSDTTDWIIHITQNPVEVMQKSYNKRWSSCENLGGGSRRLGCWDDFGNGNALALMYRASDLLDAEGNLLLNRQGACRGRTVLRWGMARVPNESQKQPRIGIETRIYGGINGSIKSELAQGLISIMENAGLWDWDDGTFRAPYGYRGYLDRGSLNYPKLAQGGVSAGGLEMQGGEATLQLTYNTQYDMSYGELQGLITQNDGDEVLLSLADNPVCWNYHRIIGGFVRNVFSMYDDNNRAELLQLLLGHEYANPALLIPALESIELISPNYQNLANTEDLIFRFAYHPRSNSDVFTTLIEVMGESSKILFALPSPPNRTAKGGPQWDSLMYCDENFWSPYVEKLLEIPIAELGADATDEQISEAFSEFGEYYAPVLDRWGGLYESAPAIVESYRTSGLGVGIWSANLLASKLLHQPKLSQGQYESVLTFYLKINQMLGTAGTGVYALDTTSMSSLPYHGQLMGGVVYQLVLNFNRMDYEGWQLYAANPSDMPPITKSKNYSPRTNESVALFLNDIYEILIFDGLGENSFPDTSAVAEVVAFVYGGCKNSSEVEMFYNFITQLITQQNSVLVDKIGLDDTMELQSKLIPMLFLSAFKRKNITKKGLRLLPQSAISAIFALLINNSFGDSYYNAVFYDFIPPGKYSDFLENLATANDDKIKGERKPKSLTEEMAFNLLTNEDILEEINIEDLARQLPDNEDLFYIMEDVILSYYLQEMYDPEGDRPFAELSIEQLNENSEENFNFKLMISNALLAIADMIAGFVKNENTPTEILERIIQKPRQESVGYRRMFEYYGMGEDYLSAKHPEGFAQTFIYPLADNKNITGRLLKYLYANYPDVRPSLMKNPNIVEARLYEKLGEEYPLELLDTFSVSKRAYLRHLRKLIKEMSISPVYDYDTTFNQFIQGIRSWVGNSSEVAELASYSVEHIINNPQTQFIRAGRCRFSTNLPTAPEGPTERNLSRRGSIPDYPQIPEGTEPFTIFRGLNLSYIKLNELTGLGENYLSALAQGDMGEVMKPTVSEQIIAIQTQMALGGINDNNIVDVERGEEEEGEIESIESRKPTTNSLFLNKKQPASRSLGRYASADLMVVLESNYVVNPDNLFATIGNYEMANLKGIRFGNGQSANAISNALYRFGSGATEEANRNALMAIIDNSPDGLEARLSSSSGAIIPYFANEEYTYPEEATNAIINNPSVREYMMRNGYATQDSPISIADAFGRIMSSFCYTSSMRYGTQNLQQSEISIINSEYNLEQVFGWIEEEYRTTLTNYDSKGRFNDRLSAFIPDWIMINTETGLPRFRSDVNEREVVPVPTWRTNFNPQGWESMIRAMKEAVGINAGEDAPLDYQDYLDEIKSFIDNINESSVVLFPSQTNSNGSNARYGLRGLDLVNNQGFYQMLNLAFQNQEMVSEMQKYHPELLKEMFGIASFTLFGNPQARAGTSTGSLVGNLNLYYNCGKELLWNTKLQNEEVQNELIFLLLALDMGEISDTGASSQNELTPEQINENQKLKWERLKTFLKNWMKDGLKSYQKYASLINDSFIPNGIATNFGSQQLRTSVNNETTYRLLVPQLFDMMVDGYIQYLRNESSRNTLKYQDFVLMVRLLNFNLPENYYSPTANDMVGYRDLQNTNAQDGTFYRGADMFRIGITDGQRANLQALRDDNLALFVQAMRTTTIREDEVFIE